jgi:hypothetical protein
MDGVDLWTPVYDDPGPEWVADGICALSTVRHQGDVREVRALAFKLRKSISSALGNGAHDTAAGDAVLFLNSTAGSQWLVDSRREIAFALAYKLTQAERTISGTVIDQHMQLLSEVLCDRPHGPMLTKATSDTVQAHLLDIERPNATLCGRTSKSTWVRGTADQRVFGEHRMCRRCQVRADEGAKFQTTPMNSGSGLASRSQRQLTESLLRRADLAAAEQQVISDSAAILAGLWHDHIARGGRLGFAVADDLGLRDPDDDFRLLESDAGRTRRAVLGALDGVRFEGTHPRQSLVREVRSRFIAGYLADHPG